MKKSTDLLKLLSEPVLRAIEAGAIEINWNQNPESEETWVDYGYPHRIYISQKIPQDLVPCEVRHEIRHVVFGHSQMSCEVHGPKAGCIITAKEIEANRFLSPKQEEAYRKISLELVSAGSSKVQKLFEGTYISRDHIKDFPAEELHAVLCEKYPPGALKYNGHCTTPIRPQNEIQGEGKAAAFLLARVLVNHGYEDAQISEGLAGGRGSRSDSWEKFVETRPVWATKILEVLLPEPCFERRRYFPKPLWSPLLFSERWIPSIRSRYTLRPKRAVILVDTSGSMWGERVLETIKPGIQALVREGLKIRLICGDDEVTWDAEIEGFGDFQLKGGGGTLYDPLLNQAMKYSPQNIIFITDLCPNQWPQKTPTVPVYFVIPSGLNLNPPWGVILCEVKEKGGKSD